MKFTPDGNQELIDRHFRIKCPHCNTISNITAISIPIYKLVERYEPNNLGIGYMCNSCNQTVFLRFEVSYDFGNFKIHLNDEKLEEIERPKEGFEFEYLPSEIEQDFREALTCYSNQCFNAFAAMCRRTIQSASNDLGAEGKSKVQKQIKDLKQMAKIDDETFDILQTIIISGHDGAHPHLPSLNSDRSEILLELMKDVLYQLFVRKAKLKEAMEKRKEVIDKEK